MYNQKAQKGLYNSTTLNYIEHFLISVSAINGCISIPAFASLFGFLIGIASSVVGLKSFAIAAKIKTYKSIIKKEKNTYDKMVLLAKCKLSSIEFLISKSLIDSNICHDVLKEFGDMIKEIKYLKT